MLNVKLPSAQAVAAEKNFFHTREDEYASGKLPSQALVGINFAAIRNTHHN
jgi:hypothetical protein